MDVIDFEAYEQLFDLDEENDDSFSKGLLDGFYEQVTETIARMEAAIQAKDHAEITHAAHFLKGSSGVIGAAQVREFCANIEAHPHLATRQSMEKLRALTESFRAAVASLAGP